MRYLGYGRADDYLDGVDKAKSGNPNVLFILMDDMGYADTSLNGAIYDTPNMDRIGEEGINFDNFYSSYSVCSPARFALMTGRYPFRGYADNVIYPTVDTLAPLAQTRIFNSIEMGNNCDGMLGDEITVDLFSDSKFVDVVGTSKGKGFQGVVKRHGFGGVQQTTHGQHNRLRAPGSIGACSYPAKVFKGMRMAGRMGGESVTVQNLQVLKVIPENNLLILKGSLPGAKGSIVIVNK